MFGQTFTHQEVLKDASLGIHEVRILSVKERNIKGYNCLEIAIEYENGEKLSPPLFRIFDATPQDTQEQQKAFSYKLSALCKSFGLPEQFDSFSLQSWAGHIGKVEIGRDANGYLAVNRFVV